MQFFFLKVQGRATLRALFDDHLTARTMGVAFSLRVGKFPRRACPDPSACLYNSRTLKFKELVSFSFIPLFHFLHPFLVAI